MRLNWKIISLPAATLILCLTFASFPVMADTVQESSIPKSESDQKAAYASQIRDKIKGFAGELMQELQAALAKGGPAEAISVCTAKAPEIANRISRQTGWMVHRVSLKTRNPLNRPDEYETKIMHQLESGAPTGEQKDEVYDIVNMEGRTEFRYVKIIRLAAPCLKCHGPADQISPEVKDKLKTHYPHDKATGYQLDDIRGAFSVRMPLN